MNKAVLSKNDILLVKNMLIFILKNDKIFQKYAKAEKIIGTTTLWDAGDWGVEAEEKLANYIANTFGFLEPLKWYALLHDTVDQVVEKILNESEKAVENAVLFVIQEAARTEVDNEKLEITLETEICGGLKFTFDNLLKIVLSLNEVFQVRLPAEKTFWDERIESLTVGEIFLGVTME